MNNVRLIQDLYGIDAVRILLFTAQKNFPVNRKSVQHMMSISVTLWFYK